MNIADLDYSASVNLNDLFDNPHHHSISGGLGTSQSSCSLSADNFTQRTKFFGSRMALDDLYGIFSRIFPPSSDGTYSITDLTISTESLDSNGDIVSSSIAGQGTMGDSRFSFSASSASAGL